MHAGASAKVLLALSTREEIDDVLAHTTLTRYTDRTVGDPSVLRTQLRTIREHGYVVSDGEVDEGVRGVAAPVFNPDGRIAAGLSIAGPLFRLDDAALPAAIRAVRDGAGALSARLGDLDS